MKFLDGIGTFVLACILICALYAAPADLKWAAAVALGVFVVLTPAVGSKRPRALSSAPTAERSTPLSTAGRRRVTDASPERN